MSKKILIIDYKLGNLFSVEQALLSLGLEVSITSSEQDIVNADALVLPGVGAFAEAMDNLSNLNLTNALTKAVVDDKKPLMGICLGLQLLFDSSEEFKNTAGLGFVSGTVKKFPQKTAYGEKLRVPQIAWNEIRKPADVIWTDTPLEEIQDGADMYFVHSYFVEPVDNSITLSTTNYSSVNYTSSILKDNIFACQFHPEKSAQEGLKIYKKWAEINNLI